MPRGKELDPTLRAKIVVLRDDGNSYAAIGATLNVNPDTARKVYNKYSTSEDYKSDPRSGRPKLLDEINTSVIKHYVRYDRNKRRKPLGEINTALNLPVSIYTLQRCMKEDIGLGRRVARKTPWLSSVQKQKRLEFAKRVAKWGNEEWRRVVWSDEMPIQTSDNSGKVYVWRFPEEEYLEDCCCATVQQGFEKVKIWAAIRYGAKSKMVILPENKEGEKMSAERYLEQVLDGELFDFWQSSMEECGHVYVMEDGAPYHQGVASKRRIQLKEDGWEGWGPRTWPSNSPDLNPIENVWPILKRQVRARRDEIHSKQDLIRILLEEWEKVPIESINNICDSIKERVQKVIQAKGGTIGK